MKKFALLVSAFALTTSAAFAFGCEDRCPGGFCSVDLGEDLTSQIPEISVFDLYGFHKISDVAQYKNADWSNVVGISKGISLTEACEIANNDPSITYFFHMKGGQMVLETEGGYRVFRHGDAVFFTGEPWWGTAPGFSDGYVKTAQ
jgi:hypothetical protein